jgi:hypothetical protein
VQIGVVLQQKCVVDGWRFEKKLVGANLKFKITYEVVYAIIPKRVNE